MVAFYNLLGFEVQPVHSYSMFLQKFEWFGMVRLFQVLRCQEENLLQFFHEGSSLKENFGE